MRLPVQSISIAFLKSLLVIKEKRLKANVKALFNGLGDKNVRLIISGVVILRRGGIHCGKSCRGNAELCNRSGVRSSALYR